MQSTWVTLVVAGIAAVASIGAAVVAGMFAWRARRADAEAQRARDLESRISERKYEIYEPMINYLRDMLSGGIANPSDAEREAGSARFRDFSTWISIYGSDEAVEAFHNFMQAAFTGAPPQIFLRLYGDFMVAARKDMGYADTAIRREHLLGMKINDIYRQPNVIDPALDEVCDRLGWQPPWLSPDVVAFVDE